MVDPGLNGRVALVTGANQGIGAAAAVALAAQGAAVFLTYLRLSPDERASAASYPPEYGQLRTRTADDVVQRIRHDGGMAECMEADLVDPTVPQLLFDRAEAAAGPVEILVNNASGWLANTFLPQSQDRFGRTLRPVDANSHDRQFAVDARAAALLIAEFARRHLQRGATWGRIIGLTSGGPGGFPEEISYGAAKAALENYTMSAAKELADLGITANCVQPPVTDTGWVTDAVRDFVRTSSDHVHVATPEEVAEVIAFLV